MDYTTTEAYMRGIEQAKAQLAKPRATSISVSVVRYGEDMGREWFDLCLICHNDRDSSRCPHSDDGVMAQESTSTTVTDNG